MTEKLNDQLKVTPGSAGPGWATTIRNGKQEVWVGGASSYPAVRRCCFKSDVIVSRTFSKQTESCWKSSEI